MINSNTPLVSICIPLYDGEEYLRESLDSIVSQSYPHFEVIIVDDGSTDGSLKIVEEYSMLDQRLKVFRNEQNLGLVGNWNKCISLTAGEWIKFQFQDDIMEKDAIEKMIRSALEWNVHLVLSDRKYIECGRNGTLKKYNRIKRLYHFVGESRKVNPKEMSEIACVDHIEYNFLGEPIVGLMHRDVIKQYGIFDDLFSQLVDMEYWLRISTNETIGFLSDTLHTFRIHHNSQSTKNNKVQGLRPGLIDRVMLLEKIGDHPAYTTFRENAFQSNDILMTEWINTGLSKIICKVGYFNYRNTLGRKRIPKMLKRSPLKMLTALSTDLSKTIERLFS